MKRIFLLALLTTAVIAQNVMIFPDLSAGSNSQFQVSVAVENTDSFVGFQFDLPLGDELEYVSSSATLTTRANGHSISASIIGDNTLRLFAYSLSQVPFNGSEGAVCTFTIETGTIPGTYSLIPVDPIIGDVNSVNILTSVTNGQVVLSAPDIDVSPQTLNYDRVPLSGYSDRSFTISNQGNATLEVSSITSSLADFEVLGSSTRSISGGSSESVTIRFHSNTKGIYAETVTIQSDDPDEPTQTVQLDVIAYAVNELDINDMFGRSGHGSNMTIDIANMEPFVGFSFDLQLPSVMTYSPTTVQLTSRAVDHVVDATTLQNGNVRIVAYSPSNTAFTGNEGDVVELDFDLDGQGGYYTIQFTNPVIGDSNSDNILSDHYSGSLEIASPDLSVNQSSFNYGEVSIFDTTEVNLTISNHGSDTLHISSIESDEASFWTETATPLSINPSSNTSIPIYYHNPSEGPYTGSLRIRSNDPDEDPQDIALSASSFIPNIMRVEDVTLYSLSAGWVGISIENNEPFVGFQFDLSVPDGIAYTGTAQLSDRAQSHQVSVTNLGDGLLRTIVYSLDQSEFTGTSGEVLALEFNVSDSVLTLQPSLSDPVIGNAASENVLSSYENGTVQVLYGGPVLSAIDELSLSEDTDSLVLRTSFHAFVTDPNTVDADLSYELLSSTHITVTPDGDNWTVAPEENWNGSENLQLIVSDENYADTTSWVLTVSPVNDAPVLAELSAQEITEDGSLVLVLSADDIDGDNLSYSAESADANVVVSVSNDSLYMTPSVDWNGSSVITVTVDDGSGSDNSTDSGTFTLTVTPVNDVPVLADISSQSTPEETAVDVALSADDIDEDALTFSAESDTSAVGVSITGSTLTLTPGTDFIGDAEITVTVTDGTLEDSGSFVLTVSPVNDSPVLADISSQEIAEDGDLVIVLSADDIDGDNLTFSAESADANVTVYVSNDSLYMTPAVNWNGSSVITVTVDDGSGSDNATNTGLFTLTVTPVNDAPVLTDISAQNTPEETAVDVALSADDIDEDALTYSAVSDTSAVQVLVTGSTLTLTPQTNFIGGATITVVVMDTSLSDTGSFTLSVNPVNDAPVLTDLTDHEIIEDSSLVIVLSAEDIDGDNLTYSAVSAESAVGVIVSNDSLYMTPSADWNGSSVITVTVDDGSGEDNATDSDTFTLTVLPVNDAPVLADISAQNTPEETAVDVAFSADDIDEDALTYSAVSDTSAVQVSVTGSTLTLSPQTNWNGVALITVIVNDSTETANSTDTTSFHLTVTPVNDPPQIHTAIRDTSILEDSVLTIPFWISDDDETDTLSVTLSGNVDNLSASYTDSILTIVPNENWNGSVGVILLVSDNDTTVTDTFSLVVLPVNDPPQAFDLISPGHELVVADGDSVDVTFRWEVAQDVDGDQLLHGLSIFSGSEFDSLFIGDENELRVNIETFPRDIWLTWEVWVTDGQDTIWSTSAFQLMIDQVVGIDDNDMIPDEFVLNQNYPNPFNPTTTIRYGLPDVADISVIIYDLKGREIRFWNFESQTAGWYNLTWQGDSQGGEQIGTGLYFCRIVGGNYSRTIKMIYMK